MNNILITGGCGFVGSNIAVFIKKINPNFNIICLDNLKRRGSELNLSRLKKNQIEFLHGDVRLPSDLDIDTKFDLIIECSAEPSVMAGVNGNPNYLISTNINGTLNCLELARRDKASIIFLSTSRVYPVDELSKATIQESESRFDFDNSQARTGITKNGLSEDVNINGYKTLYGATKLASEMLIIEYSAVYGINAIINRCGLLSGPWQFGKVDQGVIVLWVAKHYWGKPLSYIGFGGSGKQVRDVLHIDDFCNLINIQIGRINEFRGEIFNVGGGRKNSISLKELTDLTEKIVKKKTNIVKDINDRSGDIPIYITDNKNVSRIFNWEPKKTVDTVIVDIHKWIKNNEIILKEILN